MTRKLSVDPYRYGPFLCAACDREIRARQFHAVLSGPSALSSATDSERESTASAMVCEKCQGSNAAHTKLRPDCREPGCTLADHAWVLISDRAGAVRWLSDHGKMQRPE